jgi:hypothetical protein
MNDFRMNILNQINDEIDSLMHTEFSEIGAEPIMEEDKVLIFKPITNMTVIITYFGWSKKHPKIQEDPHISYDLITDGKWVSCLCSKKYRFVHNIDNYGVNNYAQLVCDNLLIPAMEKSMHYQFQDQVPIP